MKTSNKKVEQKKETKQEPKKVHLKAYKVRGLEVMAKDHKDAIKVAKEQNKKK